MGYSQHCFAYQDNGNISVLKNTGKKPRMEGEDENVPLFQGNEIEDPKQYWFLFEAVWVVKQVQDYDIKKGQLATTFWGWVLEQYMKFVEVPTGNPQKTQAQIRIRIAEEFEKPKSKSQYIT